MKNENVKFHKRHVTIETPCHISELEALIHVVAESGGYADGKVSIDDDKIVIMYGDNEE